MTQSLCTELQLQGKHLLPHSHLTYTLDMKKEEREREGNLVPLFSQSFRLFLYVYVRGERERERERVICMPLSFTAGGRGSVSRGERLQNGLPRRLSRAHLCHHGRVLAQGSQPTSELCSHHKTPLSRVVETAAIFSPFHFPADTCTFNDVMCTCVQVDVVISTVKV